MSFRVFLEKLLGRYHPSEPPIQPMTSSRPACCSPTVPKVSREQAVKKTTAKAVKSPSQPRSTPPVQVETRRTYDDSDTFSSTVMPILVAEELSSSFGGGFDSGGSCMPDFSGGGGDFGGGGAGGSW